jgi:hypothetical protein
MKKQTEEAEAAEIYEFEYPFIWKPYDPPFLEGPKGEWKPGAITENEGNGGSFTYAHGMGKCRITVVDRYRPKGCHERTFFRREWISPQGDAFGRQTLRMTSSVAFKRLIKGYRFDVEDIIPNGTPLEQKAA